MKASVGCDCSPSVPQSQPTDTSTDRSARWTIFSGPYFHSNRPGPDIAA